MTEDDYPAQAAADAAHAAHVSFEAAKMARAAYVRAAAAPVGWRSTPEGRDAGDVLDLIGGDLEDARAWVGRAYMAACEAHDDFDPDDAALSAAAAASATRRVTDAYERIVSLAASLPAVDLAPQAAS